MLTKEQLIAIKTKEVELSGLGKVTIRKLKIKEVYEKGKSFEEETLKLLSLSLVKPQMSPEEVAEMDSDASLQLQDEVMEFSGLTPTAADELEKN
jgi:hypothetical protein